MRTREQGAHNIQHVNTLLVTTVGHRLHRWNGGGGGRRVQCPVNWGFSRLLPTAFLFAAGFLIVTAILHATGCSPCALGYGSSASALLQHSTFVARRYWGQSEEVTMEGIAASRIVRAAIHKYETASLIYLFPANGRELVSNAWLRTAAVDTCRKLCRRMIIKSCLSRQCLRVRRQESRDCNALHGVMVW